MLIKVYIGGTMRLGELIKELRLSKNILSKNLYNKILSRPSIVKFENGESDTSTDKLLKIVDRLNMSLEEIYYIYSQKNDLDNPFLTTSDYMLAFYKRDLKKLKELSDLYKSKYIEESNVKYRHYQAIVNLLIYSLEKNGRYEDDFEVIKNYLVKCDSWGYYELTLFNNSLSFFSNELIDTVYQKSKKKLSNYNFLVRYKNENSILILNILEKKILEKNILSAKTYFQDLKSLKDNTLDNMYLQTMIKFFGEVLNFIDGDSSKEKEIIKIVDFFEFLNMEHKGIQCEQFFEIVKTY